MTDSEKPKNRVILKEYGKNIQKLVDYIKTVPDQEKRTEYAFALVELMKQLNPQLKSESDQKLWDDMYIMSDFELVVDGPFPMPPKELLGRKPKRVGYPDGEVKFKHYGRNIEKLIEKAIEIEDDGTREIDPDYNTEIDHLFKAMKYDWDCNSESKVFDPRDKPAIIEIFGKPLERIHMAKLYLNVDGDIIDNTGILTEEEIRQAENLKEQFGIETDSTLEIMGDPKGKNIKYK